MYRELQQFSFEETRELARMMAEFVSAMSALGVVDVFESRRFCRQRRYAVWSNDLCQG
jgi:hypothetical protein